jgi:hypothetical protein
MYPMSFCEFPDVLGETALGSHHSRLEDFAQFPESLHLFMEKYRPKKALKISQAPFEAGFPAVSLPFYAIEGFLKQED